MIYIISLKSELFIFYHFPLHFFTLSYFSEIYLSICAHIDKSYFSIYYFFIILRERKDFDYAFTKKNYRRIVKNFQRDRKSGTHRDYRRSHHGKFNSDRPQHIYSYIFNTHSLCGLKCKQHCSSDRSHADFTSYEHHTYHCRQHC